MGHGGASALGRQCVAEVPSVEAPAVGSADLKHSRVMERISYSQCPRSQCPRSQFPMTAGATTLVTSRAGSPLRIDPTGNRAALTHRNALPMADTLLKSGNPSCAGVLPNAQCPIPNAHVPNYQLPITNYQLPFSPLPLNISNALVSNSVITAGSFSYQIRISFNASSVLSEE